MSEKQILMAIFVIYLNTFVGRYDKYCSKCGAKLVDE